MSVQRMEPASPSLVARLHSLSVVRFEELTLFSSDVVLIYRMSPRVSSPGVFLSAFSRALMFLAQVVPLSRMRRIGTCFSGSCDRCLSLISSARPLAKLLALVCSVDGSTSAVL